MTNYILFNQTLKSVSGFETDEAILKITNYQVNNNIDLTQDEVKQTSTVSINYVLYKSLTDKDNGEQPFQVKSSLGEANAFPINIWMSFSTTLSDLDDVYQIALNKFVDLGYAAELNEVI